MKDESTASGDLVSIDSDNQLAPRPKRNFAIVVLSVLICDLKPLAEPQVDPEFAAMPTVERAIEVLRYNLALLEYRLGSNGWLRAWIFSTLRVLFFLLVPLAAFSVLIAVLVPAMAGIAQIFASLEAACKSLFWACVYLVLSLVVIAGTLAFAGVLSLVRLRRKLGLQAFNQREPIQSRSGGRN
jgi:hypothetical protein